jgi:hypothetical protein
LPASGGRQILGCPNAQEFTLADKNIFSGFRGHYCLFPDPDHDCFQPDL